VAVERFEKFDFGMTDLYVNGPKNASKLIRNMFVERDGKLRQRNGTVVSDGWGQLPLGTVPVSQGKFLYHGATLSYYMHQQGSKLYVNTITPGDLKNSEMDTLGAFTPSEISVHGGSSFAVQYDQDSAEPPTVTKWLDRWSFLTQSRYAYVAKIFREDASGNATITTAGMPAPDGVTVRAILGGTGTTGCPGTPGTAGSALSSPPKWLYYVTYATTFILDGVTFTDESPPKLLEVDFRLDLGDDIEISFDALSNTLTGGFRTHWDTGAGTKIRIYRTTKNGTVPYLIHENANCTGIFVDDHLVNTDTVIQGNEVAYFQSELDNDPPPRALYHTITDQNVAFYGNVEEYTDSTQTAFKATTTFIRQTHRLRYSKPNDPDSCPGSFFIDFNDEITGLGYIRNYCIVFLEDRCYRVEGLTDATGAGVTREITISKTVGCVEHASIVKVDHYLYFASENGFYRTDGFRVEKISTHLDERYCANTRTVLQRKQLVGSYSTAERRVYWTMATEEPGASDPGGDVIFVHDTKFPVQGEMGVFTDQTFPSIDIAGAVVVKMMGLNEVDLGKFIATNAGYIYREDENSTTDPLVDTGSAINTWRERPVVWDYISGASSYGTEMHRKWGIKAAVFCRRVTADLTMQLFSINDDRDDDERPMREVLIRNNTGNMHQFSRHFPKRSLRFMYKQLRLTNAGTVIIESGSTFNTTITLTIVGGKMRAVRSSGTWATIGSGAIVPGQYLSVQQDSFAELYLIEAVSGDTLTLEDEALELTEQAGQDFQIRGQVSGEVMHLNAYNVEYAQLGESIQSFPSE
jgi:hypothetical protein